MRSLRAEIETVLAGGVEETVPFSFYDLLFPPGFDPSSLQSQGMAICARRNVYRKIAPNVKETVIREPDGGIRTKFDTPVGTLTRLERPGAAGTAPLEHPVKTLEDYRAAEFIVKDTLYEPDYDSFRVEEARIGDAGVVIAHSGYSPLLEIQIYWLGQEQFCYEIADHEDAVMSLYEALVQSQRYMYQVVARSPACHVLHCGNVVPVMLGPDRIKQYVFPCYESFAAELHSHGKMLGVHLDADNRLIMDAVRHSSLDMVEAFNPPPDCPVSVAEARRSWPGKRLWVNFPSSIHLEPDAVIRRTTLDLLRQAGDRRGFLIGVTEDIPPAHLERSVRVILDTLRSVE